jgi:hypothetical protein
LRTFEAQIEFAHRGGVVTRFVAIGIDGVIGARIDHAAETRVVPVLVAVIGQRHQPFAQHAAFCVKRKARVGVEVVERFCRRLHPVVERVVPNGTRSKADDSPRTVARIEPGFDRLLARHLVVAESEIHRERSRRGRRFQLDIGNAIVAIDLPHRLRAFEARKLTRLLGVGFDCGIIRGRDAEVAGQAGTDRLAVAVGQAHRDNGAGHAVGNQNRFFADQRCAHRGDRVMDVALQRLDRDAIGILHFGDQAVFAFANFEPAPQADRDAAVGRLACPFECQCVGGFAVHAQ